MNKVELTEEATPRGKTYSGSVGDGEFAVVQTPRKDVTVAYFPASGATATIKQITSPVSTFDDDSYNSITHETATEDGSDTVYGPITGVRLEASGGDVAFEVVI